MPKKSEFLPPPKPDSHPEEAAILTRIFKKEPLITYRDLLDKYKSEVSEKQALSGLLGLFTAYVDRPDDDPLFPQLMQAKQAALQMEILSRQPRRALLDRVQPVMDKNDLLAMQQQVDEVYMSDEIRRYIVELSRATRQDSRLTLGLSPRASLAVAGMARAAAFLSGRNYVAPQDITAIFADAARHRLRLTEQARTGGDTVQNILDDVLHTVPRPRPEKPFHGR